ncbi:MAG: tetratricopeptide repeat protein [Armatimonadetes bacterium]|nr:tetratricopeptide repeat protein [Armatimonadota bacterium]
MARSRTPTEPRQKHEGPPQADSPPPLPGRSIVRLVLLTTLLALVLGVYAFSGGWRRRLEAESAYHRALVRRVEAQRASAQTLEQQVGSLQSGYEADPSNPDARLALAEARWKQAGPAAALPILDAAVHPWSDSRLPRLMAHSYRTLRREDLALRTLQAAIKQFPRDGDLLADRGFLHVLLGWHRDAEVDLAAAARLGSAELPLATAALERARGNRTEAERILREARKDRPGDPEIPRWLAALADAGGRYSEAVELLAPLADNEGLPEDRLALAAAQWKVGRPASSRAALETLELLRTAQGGKESGRARFLRARCLIRLKRESEARLELERLVREAPDLFGPAYALAELLQKMGRRAEASALRLRHQTQLEGRAGLRRAGDRLLQAPDDPEAHREVGRQCLQQRFYGRAIVELERARELDPGLVGLEEELESARRQVGGVVGEVAD